MISVRFLIRVGIPLFAGMFALAISLESAGAQQNSVLTYHGDAGRSGNFVVPVLIWEKARSVHLDPSFDARVAGHLYAQPLYWHASGSNPAMLLVATEDGRSSFRCDNRQGIVETVGRASSYGFVVAMRQYQSTWYNRDAGHRSLHRSDLF